VLAEGGSAIDAVLTVALDQVVLSAGCWNSLAGIAGLLYYDAASGRAHALDGSYRSFADELHPWTIPADGASGRSALVPGFMALVQAAHERFGRVPFQRLFQPAIEHAENGIVVTEWLEAFFRARAPVLTRLAATARVYAPAGELPRQGDTFRQPALAATLHHVAREGADYMYRGAWAEHFVDAVRAEGGQARLDDLAAYVAEWSTPRCTPYAGASVCSMGGRNGGGAALLEALSVAAAAGLPAQGGWQDSVEALYWTVRATQVGLLLELAPQLVPDEPQFLLNRLAAVARSADERLSAEQAQRLVAHVSSGAWDQAIVELSERLSTAAIRAPSAHSDGIVVIDADGNAATLIHSINTEAWGTTGLNVDGVSIPDSASFQQGGLEWVGPGQYLGAMLNPALVFTGDRLRLAASSVGNIHYAMFGQLRAHLDLHSPVPELVGTAVVSGAPYAELVPPASASAELLAAARGLGLQVSSGVDPVPPYWLAIEAGDELGVLVGAVSPALARLGGGARGR
jgi:gamma-glutamyltranspeptidase/glutathione hydrolase